MFDCSPYSIEYTAIRITTRVRLEVDAMSALPCPTLPSFPGAHGFTGYVRVRVRVRVIIGRIVISSNVTL